jgi:hypothetical protein
VSVQESPEESPLRIATPNRVIASRGEATLVLTTVEVDARMVVVTTRSLFAGAMPEPTAWNDRAGMDPEDLSPWEDVQVELTDELGIPFEWYGTQWGGSTAEGIGQHSFLVENRDPSGIEHVVVTFQLDDRDEGFDETVVIPARETPG